jgi:hypothetical protein
MMSLVPNTTILSKLLPNETKPAKSQTPQNHHHLKENNQQLTLYEKAQKEFLTRHSTYLRFS